MYKSDYIFHCVAPAPAFVRLFLLSSRGLSRFANYRFVSNIIMTSVCAACLIDGYERTITGQVFALARVTRNEPLKKTGHQ